MGQHLGEDIRKLGFGMMRLPKNGETIDVETTKVMVDKFMAAGFTYFDTAWVYQGSDDATRQALVERYPRESFQLATKNAAWCECKTREDAIAQFETSLKRLGTDYFDLYLHHQVNDDVPLEETIGALNEMRDAYTVAGLRGVSMSNVFNG